VLVKQSPAPLVSATDYHFGGYHAPTSLLTSEGRVHLWRDVLEMRSPLRSAYISEYLIVLSAADVGYGSPWRWIEAGPNVCYAANSN
jgi:hypothetical protein